MVMPIRLLLLLVGVERLVELAVSARHARLAFARGGQEAGQGHWLPMRLLHTGLLLGCWLEAEWGLWPLPLWQFQVALAGVLIAQVLRYWAVLSLGRAWNTRVIVVPGDRATRRGPYRFVRHPNYVAVVLEGVALPLACSAYITLVLFFLLNTWLLSVRIVAEEQLLRRFAKQYDQVGTRT